MRSFLEYIVEYGGAAAPQQPKKAVTGMAISPEGESEKLKAIDNLASAGLIDDLPSSPMSGSPDQRTLMPQKQAAPHQQDFTQSAEEALTSQDPRDSWRLTNRSDQVDRSKWVQQQQVR
jgi:hypothetical protein